MAAAVFVSCDGGRIVASPASVWHERSGAWEQLHGAPAARPSRQGAERASCAQAPISNTPPVLGGATRIGGSSRDRSLLWSAETRGGTTRFVARLWTGEAYRTVIDE